MLGTKKELDNEARVELAKRKLLDRIEGALELSGEGSAMESKWKASGMLQGLCAAYASLERLAHIKQ